MRGEHAVSMSTAFNRKITGFGIESNLCILRDQIGVQIIAADENRPIVRQPFAGDIDFSRKTSPKAIKETLPPDDPRV